MSENMHFANTSWPYVGGYIFDISLPFPLQATENLDELVSAVMQRIGSSDSSNRPQLLVSLHCHTAFCYIFICFVFDLNFFNYSTKMMKVIKYCSHVILISLVLLFMLDQ